MDVSEPVRSSLSFDTAFAQRTSSSIFEPNLTPKSEAELMARSTIPHSDLAGTDAAPLVPQNVASEKEHPDWPDRAGGRAFKQADSSMPPNAETPPARAVRSGRVSSFGLRTITIILSFMAGAGVIMLSNASWVLPWRPEPAVAISSPASPQPSTATESALKESFSEMASQLESYRTELISLRQDIKSLFDELAQVRRAQEDLITAQAQSGRKSNQTAVRQIAGRHPR